MASNGDRILFVALAGLLCAEAIRIRSSPPPLAPRAAAWDRPAALPQLLRGLGAVDQEMFEVLDQAPGDLSLPPEVLEKDMEIYRRHWFPLEPPPYHDPAAQYPTFEQMFKLEKTADNYTKYWRGLPKYSVSPLVHEVQKAPYLKLRNWSNYTSALRLRPGTPEENVSRKLLFACHHKAGVTIHSHLQEEGLPRKFEYLEWHEPLPQDFIGDWPSDLKVIHFVRDPVDIILSGYRYHQRRWGAETPMWGHARLQDPPCFECDDEDHKVLFDTCSFNCTYFELLNRVDETSGVALEAVSARLTLTSMATFMSAHAENPNALHLSMDLLQNQGNQTAACMLKFLGFGENRTLQKRLVDSTKVVYDPSHITAGAFNNSQLRTFLKNHPVWGPDFRAMTAAMAEAFRRQAAIWGCPASEDA